MIELVANKFKIVVMLAFLPVFLYLWPSFLGGDTEFIIINGESMLPTITSGSLAIAKNTQAYDVGEIVAYKDESNNRLVVHRIIEQKENGFIFKGDNNRAKDAGIIKPESIRGEVIFVAPYMGYLSHYLKNPVIMALATLASMAVIVTKKDKKKKNIQYSFFSIAIITNLLSYIVMQVSITGGITPKMDGYTNYLFEIFEPYVASTMAFATWFFVIIGIHFMTKYYQVHSAKKFARFSQKGMVQIKQDTSIEFAAQAFYLLSMTIQMLYLVVALKGLFPQG